jgi:hypothetical protein
VYGENEIAGVTQYDPVVNLRCDFTPLADQTLFYQIDWYADSNTISKQTVKATSLNDATLSTKILSDKKIKIGTSVRCLNSIRK